MNQGEHHILVIEDEQPIRRFLRASLANEGYQVSEAVSGEEGLRMASSQPPDLVILDLGLPDLDGQDVLQLLREWYTSLPAAGSLGTTGFTREPLPAGLRRPSSSQAGGRLGPSRYILTEQGVGYRFAAE